MPRHWTAEQHYAAEKWFEHYGAVTPEERLEVIVLEMQKIVSEMRLEALPRR